jgi:hypothetical protein
MDFRINRKKKDEKSLWSQRGRQVQDVAGEKQSEPAKQEESSKYSFSKLRDKLFGKTAAEVATEQVKKLRKKKLGY